jgi:glycosyltransferase involved in cell wall biosynthesis
VTRVFLSYAYPPFEAPRAVQVERLARHLPGEVHVFCGEVERVSGPAPAHGSDGVTRVTWGRRASVRRALHARVLRGRLDVPDRYRPWAADAVRALRGRTWREGDVLVSFGQPWSDHLAALRFTRRAGVPWVAHFSDPWVKNPLRTLRPELRAIDRRQERAVVQRADLVVFTNHETLDLVMAAYPAPWREKARVVPHAFEPGDEGAVARGPEEPIVARYLGAFYGRRSPAALVTALARLRQERPSVLDGVRFELIGPSEIQTSSDLVRTRGPVDYPTSVELMRSADLLLVIDAPGEESPFLPSKLVDYVGAAKPIVALSPPGPSARLVTRLGGWVADPARAADCASAISAALAFARAAPRREAWGDPTVRAEYRADRVAAAFDAVLADAARAHRGGAAPSSSR